MLFRRLMAGLLVLGVLVSVAVPVLAQKEKDKDKVKDKDKGKTTDKDKGKTTDKDKDKDKGKEVKVATGAPANLKWQLPKGKIFYQRMMTETDQNMTVMANNVNQKQKQIFYFKYEVTDSKEDKATIDMTIIGVAMNIQIGGSNIEYDSTKPEGGAQNPLGDFFKALKDSKFTIELDPKTNKVGKVDGREAFIGKLVAANPQMKPLLETILSADALKEMAEPTFAVVPTKSGDAEWTRTSKLDMGPIGKYENTYKFKYTGKEGAGDKEVAKINVETTLNYTQPGGDAGQGGLPFKIKSATLTSTNKEGDLRFNLGKGRLESSKTVLDLKGELSIEIGGTTTKVELRQTQTSQIETMEDDPTKTDRKSVV